jgi:hypothetical protein
MSLAEAFACRSPPLTPSLAPLARGKGFQFPFAAAFSCRSLLQTPSLARSCPLASLAAAPRLSQPTSTISFKVSESGQAAISFLRSSHLLLSFTSIFSMRLFSIRCRTCTALSASSDLRFRFLSLLLACERAKRTKKES